MSKILWILFSSEAAATVTSFTEPTLACFMFLKQHKEFTEGNKKSGKLGVYLWSLDVSTLYKSCHSHQGWKGTDKHKEDLSLHDSPWASGIFKIHVNSRISCICKYILSNIHKKWSPQMRQYIDKGRTSENIVRAEKV